jgi:hypothetical protein
MLLLHHDYEDLQGSFVVFLCPTLTAYAQAALRHTMPLCPVISYMHCANHCQGQASLLCFSDASSSAKLECEWSGVDSNINKILRMNIR